MPDAPKRVPPWVVPRPASPAQPAAPRRNLDQTADPASHDLRGHYPSPDAPGHIPTPDEDRAASAWPAETSSQGWDSSYSGSPDAVDSRNHPDYRYNSDGTMTGGAPRTNSVPTADPVYEGAPQYPPYDYRAPAEDPLRRPQETSLGDLLQTGRPTWRSRLRSTAAGLITFGGNTDRQAIAELVEHVRQPVHTPMRIAVLSLKGGVGKTTVSVSLGSALASLRRERVVAIDANPDLGTLARRVPLQTHSTIRNLLADPDVSDYAGIRLHTNQSPSGLEVLASERDPDVSEAFTGDDYLDALDILEPHYPIVITDCGTGLNHSSMAGVLTSVNAIVVVTSPAIDGAESAAATLDWLASHGYERLARESVVVIMAAHAKNPPVDINVLTNFFAPRTRAVQVVPHDPHLAVGAHVDLGLLRNQTRAALVELSATVMDGFTGQ